MDMAREEVIRCWLAWVTTSIGVRAHKRREVGSGSRSNFGPEYKTMQYILLLLLRSMPVHIHVVGGSR